MVDIDLDIITEKPIEIMLFGIKRKLRSLTMEESFELKALRQEIAETATSTKKDMKKFKEKKKILLELLIDPITYQETENIKQKQFEQLMDEVDYMDIRDQGVVQNKEEYRQLKTDLAKRTAGSGTGFPVM